ncbi:hypothetical protein PIROE2DRAFT_4907 [Piromyces sp. E2]|nr:hypothetical protein PIROE2DRAFT_4907 [Piromyces sp. E2]|eukprot:OUM67618.1 hypothetical protein PIROE2DRAFT_4907 [Piromyces sp. E2]
MALNKYIYIKFLLIWINITFDYVLSETLRGYFYNIFPKDIPIDSIKTKIEDNFSTILVSKEKLYDLKIEIDFSSQTNYTDYVKYDIKREIVDSKYHFFLIKLNTLFDDFQNYKNAISIFSRKEENPFYLQTLPLDSSGFNFKSYLENANTSESLDLDIVNDCKLNDKYYALPFSASYNYLFYNKDLMEFMNINLKSVMSYSEIEDIITKFKKLENSDNYNGLVLSLNDKEKVASFFLEGLFSNNTKSYNTCAKGYMKKSVFFDFEKCNGDDSIFYGEKASSWFKTIKQYFDNDIISEQSLHFSEEDAFNEFSNGFSLFFKGNSESYAKFAAQNNTAISKDGRISRVGSIFLPGMFSTYDSYILIGNYNKEFKDKYGLIAKAITVLVSNGAQIIREQDYNITAPYNYQYMLNKEDSLDSNKALNDKLENYKTLSKLKKLSITNTLFNENSSSNNIILNHLYKNFVDYIKNEKHGVYMYKRADSQNISNINNSQTEPKVIPKNANTTKRIAEKPKTTDNSDNKNTENIEIAEKPEFTEKPENTTTENINNSEITNTTETIKTDNTNVSDTNSIDIEIIKKGNLDKLILTLKNDLIISYTKLNSFVGLLDVVFFVVGNIYAYTLVFLIIYHKDNKYIKKASPKLCALFVIGITSLFYIPVFNIGIPTKFTCIIRHYIIYMLISIALSTYLMKLWKFLSVCNVYKSKKVLGIPITNNSLNTIITAVISIELVSHVLWDYVSPRQPGIFEIRNGERIAKCTSVNDNIFKRFSILFILLLYFFIAYITFKVRKAPEYRHEYHAFIWTALMMIFLSITVTISLFISSKLEITEFMDNSLSFICGILILSLIVTPSLKNAISRESFTKSIAKSYKNNENPSSEASINRILFNDNNVNVISFKDSEDDYDLKYLSEKFITPFDGGYLVNNAKSQRSRNSSITNFGENRYFDNLNYNNNNINNNNNNNNNNMSARNNNDIDYLYESVKSYVPKLK